MSFIIYYNVLFILYEYIKCINIDKNYEKSFTIHKKCNITYKTSKYFISPLLLVKSFKYIHLKNLGGQMTVHIFLYKKMVTHLLPWQHPWCSGRITNGYNLAFTASCPMQIFFFFWILSSKKSMSYTFYTYKSFYALLRYSFLYKCTLIYRVITTFRTNDSSATCTIFLSNQTPLFLTIDYS